MCLILPKVQARVHGPRGFFVVDVIANFLDTRVLKFLRSSTTGDNSGAIIR